MRILIVLNGSTAGYSGGDLHTIMVANQWAESHQVYLCLLEGSSPEILALVDSKVNVIGGPTYFKAVGRARLLIKYLRRIVISSVEVARRRDDFDIILASSHYSFDLLPTLLRRRSTTSLVTYWHHHIGQLTDRPRWVSVMVRLSERSALSVLRRANALVLTSNSSTLEHLCSLGLRASQIELTKNGLSTLRAPSLEPFELASGTGLACSEASVLFCGRLSRLKGTRDLALLAKEWSKHSRNVTMTIMGSDGDGGIELRQALSDEIVAGRVRFTGFVDEDEKCRLFREAHVVIVPSYEEGWSVTVGDGLASRCWVVSYDLPAIREAFPVGPIYVPTGDWRRMYDEVNKCLAAPQPDKSVAGDSWREIADADLCEITEYFTQYLSRLGKSGFRGD